MLQFFFILACLLIPLGLGVQEKRIQQQRLATIPTRILVNGIRGKSTVTRFITSILKEAGVHVVGKTTGSAARMIYWDQQEEEILYRPPSGPNINEQKAVVRKATARHAQALVSECMAVDPDYQRVLQRDLIRANIVVIVNVLEDHLDVMGPTLENIAEAFAQTIPYRGTLIVPSDDFTPFFQKICRRRKTRLIVANESLVPQGYLDQFNYLVFPQNVALALGVARALGLSEELALAAMLKAAPDPGAAEVLKVLNFSENVFFVNGFAVNDAASTLAMFDYLKQLGYPTENTTFLMNCRKDRVDRTLQFAHAVLPKLHGGKIIAMGQMTGPIAEAFEQGDYPIDTFVNMEDQPVFEIMDELRTQPANSLIFTMGNIHGDAEALLDEINALSVPSSLKFSTPGGAFDDLIL
ncbi:Poly-gamma-glutamate synthase subunit PgsB/CapB [Clostridiaceae bacterium JG1575]|nr:Poly-gamma-glutamate synthase subunit PgsB/CapB [Clostridiaceae bacterium JG1575]